MKNKLVELNDYYKNKMYLLRMTVISSYILILLKYFSSNYIYWIVYTMFIVITIRLIINYISLIKKQKFRLNNFKDFYINYEGFYLKSKRHYFKNCTILCLSTILHLYIFFFSIDADNNAFRFINWILLISMLFFGIIICIFKFMNAFFMIIFITFSNIMIIIVSILFLILLLAKLTGTYKDQYIVECMTFILSFGKSIDILIIFALISIIFQMFVIINRPPSAIERTKSALKVINIISGIILLFILLYLNTLSENLYVYVKNLNSVEINQILYELNVLKTNDFTECVRKIITVVLLPFTSGNAIVSFAVDYIDQRNKKKSKNEYIKGFNMILENKDVNKAQVHFKKSVYYGGSNYEVQIRTNLLLLDQLEELMTDSKVSTRLKIGYDWVKIKTIFMFEYACMYCIDFWQGLSPIIDELKHAKIQLKKQWNDGEKKKTIKQLSILCIMFIFFLSIMTILYQYHFFVESQQKISVFIENLSTTYFKYVYEKVKSITFLLIFMFLAILNIMQVFKKQQQFRFFAKWSFLLMRGALSLILIMISFSNIFSAEKFLLVNYLMRISIITFFITLLLFVIFKDEEEI